MSVGKDVRNLTGEIFLAIEQPLADRVGRSLVFRLPACLPEWLNDISIYPNISRVWVPCCRIGISSS